MAKIDEIKRDPKLFGKLLAFSVKEHTEENILFTYDKGNMAGLYAKYIKAGAPKEINIDSKLRDKLTAAATTNNEADFKKYVVLAKNVCAGLCDQTIGRFQNSDEYKFLEAREKAEKNVAKAQKVLGISNKGKDLLIDAAAWFKIGKKGEASKLLTQLAKLEKMQQEQEVILKSLKACGLV